MGQSYRIRTELGITKTINVQLDQEFEFLEILSLKLNQQDVYLRACSDYGVIVGRVTANNGLGLPNARVSIFIPIETVDESNPVIQSIYPYKSPNDKNEDGYRYNLLPYEKSYSVHSATGTLPTRLDVLTGNTAFEIYEKYYKFTAKTNESGDYMIMGVPLGQQTVVMDLDLSDIGEFSLTPQDLIRMGRATEAQVAGNRFRTSEDLNSLPQIVNLTKVVEISPLWGEPSICQIAINRVDFDLRDEANIDIQPTSVFMGSIYSSPDNLRIRPPFSIGNFLNFGGNKPKDNLGNLCNLTTGPGQILAIRQTINLDLSGNPILEEYKLEQNGNVIDESGAWLVELPMNLDYLVTNEFGEKIISYDPTLGIPTKSKYRFKVKWQQSNSLSQPVKRPYYLVPNIKEYGWTNNNDDPNVLTNSGNQQQIKSSYYFGLDWSGYTQGFVGQHRQNRLNEIINCEDTFYEFKYNRVYTVSSLIDQYKRANRSNFIGIKEIDDDSCSDTVNKFPVNEGFRNFDFLFFIFSFLMLIISISFISVLISFHIIIFLYNLVRRVFCVLCGIKIPIINVRPFGFICRIFKIKCSNFNTTIRFPMITYPECDACSCKQDYGETPDQNSGSGNGLLSYFSSPQLYTNKFEQYFSGQTQDNNYRLNLLTIYSQVIAGNDNLINNSDVYKLPKSEDSRTQANEPMFANSLDLPLGERINNFNARTNYFYNLNKIKVSFASDVNSPGPLNQFSVFHEDNTLTILSPSQYETGTVLSFVSPGRTVDRNYLYTASTINGVTYGISGTSYSTTAATQVNVSFANTQTSSSSVTYNLPYGSDNTNYKAPQDIEYFQVVTAITISEAATLWNANSNPKSLPAILEGGMQIDLWKKTLSVSQYTKTNSDFFKFKDYFEEFSSQYILILQRGVDPYSPLYVNKFGIGKIMGLPNAEDLVVTGLTRLNIPIQPLSNTNISVQNHSQQSDVMYRSYFFAPGSQYIPYSTPNLGYYGKSDNLNKFPTQLTLNAAGADGIRTNLAKPGGLSITDSSSITAGYTANEDLSSMGYMAVSSSTFLNNINSYDAIKYFYYTKVIGFSNVMISNPVTNVMRTDRIPSSDALDGGSWDNNPAVLQQNIDFSVYEISLGEGRVDIDAYTQGANVVTSDIEGSVNSLTVFESFSCDKMVSLKCYEGFGKTFGIKPNCDQGDNVERGCYLFMRRPLLDLFKDINTWSEYSYRFRFFFGLCRGVLSQSFTNNWINGSLFMFPIQVDTFFDKNNQPKPPIFPRDTVRFDADTNNFYFRSSPYRNGVFIGKPALSFPNALNSRNLLFPTTIINLGMKDSFYDEIIPEPDTAAYIMDKLESTSYNDTSDIINLFVISRITDEGFLQRIFQFGDNSLNQLFSRYPSRPGLRLDADCAQLLSINSEFGVIPFSPEFYSSNGQNGDVVQIVGSSNNPSMAIFFSSTTEDLQNKDYISPGALDFRNGNQPAIQYRFGIKSQTVPFYRWNISNQGQNPPSVFGTQTNNWATSLTDIVSSPYQSLDRLNVASPNYFWGQDQSEPNMRGYIFNITPQGGYVTTTNGTSTAFGRPFLVGAPYQFYFGVVKGASALDKFKTKYLANE